MVKEKREKEKPVEADEVKSAEHETVVGSEEQHQTNEQQNPDLMNPTTLMADNHVSVVIPYVKNKAQGEELRFMLRSLEKYLYVGCNVVVIGDREDWFSDEVTVIEHPCTSDNPQIDVVEKLKLAIASEEVTERFIWTNDDIYFIAPVLLVHIELPKVKGILSPEGFSGVYRDNVNRTIELLTECENRFDFATHTPVVFDKQKLVDMFERFPELSAGGYLLSSVYFNTTVEGTSPILLDWKSDQWALSIVTQNPDEKRFDKLVKEKKFLNNSENGYSEWFESKLKEMFPEKSDFEE